MFLYLGEKRHESRLTSLRRAIVINKLRNWRLIDLLYYNFMIIQYLVNTLGRLEIAKKESTHSKLKLQIDILDSM